MNKELIKRLAIIERRLKALRMPSDMRHPDYDARWAERMSLTIERVAIFRKLESHDNARVTI